MRWATSRSPRNGTNNRSRQERLIGSWKLVSYEVRDDDCRGVIYPLGRDAKGYILYTLDGYLSAQIMRLNRSLFQTADPSGGTDAQSSLAARGYLAYSGPYHVEDDSVVVHEAEVSLFPNRVNQNESHMTVLTGRRLELSKTTPVQFGQEQLTAVLVWERAHVRAPVADR
jgi:Lipocalin-like domain